MPEAAGGGRRQGVAARWSFQSAGVWLLWRQAIVASGSAEVVPLPDPSLVYSTGWEGAKRFFDWRRFFGRRPGGVSLLQVKVDGVLARLQLGRQLGFIVVL